MEYKFGCCLDSNGDPSMYLKAWDNQHEHQEISHYIAKEGITRYTERRLTQTEATEKQIKVLTFLYCNGNLVSENTSCPL